MTRSDEGTESELQTVQKEVLGNQAPKPEFKAAVGLSREWDARKAGREVAENTLKKLDGKKPDFFLLFTTIHYEKHGGFKELLAGVWEVLPEGTPLIGGTVAGFINNQGCYTRGVTALAASYPNMNVATGLGKNTKRSPNMAAKECAEMIKKKLRIVNHNTNVFISLVSGATVPAIPGEGQKRVIRNIPGLDAFLKIFIPLANILQIGPGRDEDVLDKFSKDLEGFIGIGGTSCDSLNLEKNVQFFRNQIVNNSIVGIGITFDKEAFVSTSNGLKPINKNFSITETLGGGYILSKINNKPAVEGYLDVMGWSKEVLDERLYRKVFYYPFASKSKSILCTRMFGLVYGNKFICPTKPTEDRNVEIYTSSGESIIHSIESLIEGKTCNFSFFISCGTRLETMGAQSYKINEVLNKKLRNDYLVIYTSGEFSKIDGNTSAFSYQSDNALIA